MMVPQTLAACLAAIKSNPARFYVYVLSRVDGTPFYVGKGQGKRIADHECYAKNGLRGHRLAIIRGIWESGGDVAYTLVGHFDNEGDAFAQERRLISEMGRRTHGGVLTNRT